MLTTGLLSFAFKWKNLTDSKIATGGDYNNDHQGLEGISTWLEIESKQLASIKGRDSEHGTLQMP